MPENQIEDAALVSRSFAHNYKDRAESCRAKAQEVLVVKIIRMSEERQKSANVGQFQGFLPSDSFH